MEYKYKYNKYKTKYIISKGGDKINILLLHNPNIYQTNKEILNTNKSIIDKLNKLGNIYHYFFPYHYSNKKLVLEDYKFNTVAKDIFKKFKHLNNILIVCLEHASPYGLFFADK